jgi:hypothetical protein
VILRARVLLSFLPPACVLFDYRFHLFAHLPPVIHPLQQTAAASANAKKEYEAKSAKDKERYAKEMESYLPPGSGEDNRGNKDHGGEGGANGEGEDGDGSPATEMKADADDSPRIRVVEVRREGGGSWASETNLK